MGDDWIYIHGSPNHPLILLNNDYHILLQGSESNEISYVTTSGSYTPDSLTTGSGVVIEDLSNYNWIHHSTFTGHGGQSTSANNYFDGHYPFMIGGEGGGVGDLSYYNLVEDNEFKNGGHAVATDNGKYNIWRDNVMHHELYLEMADNQWQQDFTNGSVEITVGMVVQGVTSGAFATVSEVIVTSGTWGGGNAVGTIKVHYAVDGDGTGFSGFTNGETLKIRNVATNLALVSGASQQIFDYGTTYVGYHTFQSYCNDGGYGVFENNKMGFASENINPSIYAGNGFKITTPRNIVRYNDFVGNWLGGVNLIAYWVGATKYPTENHIYNNTTIGNGVHPATYNGSLAIPAKLHAINFDISAGHESQVANNVVKNNLLAEKQSDSCQTGQSGIWDQGSNAVPTGQTIVNNWDTCADPATYADPLFLSATLPAYDDRNLTAASFPNLALQATSPVINGGSYLTQTDGSGTNTTTLVVDDAKYFQDGKFGSASGCNPANWPNGANINADWIAIGTVDNAVQISSVDYSTNTITLSSAKSWDDNANLWLYKKSDGTQVLYGSASDYGAHEHAIDTTPPAAPTGLAVN